MAPLPSAPEEDDAEEDDEEEEDDQAEEVRSVWSRSRDSMAAELPVAYRMTIWKTSSG